MRKLGWNVCRLWYLWDIDWAGLPRLRFWLSAAFLTTLSVTLQLRGTHAQETESPKYEFRGTWIATVHGLDWPLSFRDEFRQKSRMIRLLDYLQDAGINAVFFQVRSLGDAMYESSYEPWSHLLTGEQGSPPNYDPLLFTIEEAHRRGMELHAWINPYRVHNSGSHNVASDHIMMTRPEWTYVAGELTYLDPGRQAVRSYVTMIVMDIVHKYDVDGIHFDDYFYPYPPDHITLGNSPDRETFQRESRGFTNIFDWRRDNINLQISQIADSLRTFNPDLKFGISPFGIWKSGVPTGIFGLDAYSVIYADAIAWIKAKTIDYLVPQLYWAFGGDQDYAKLSRWWADQIGDRHLYIGHGLYRVGTSFSASEVPNQVVFNRNHPGISGSVFFRASHLHPLQAGRFAQIIRSGLYKYPALPPPMDWKNQTAPSAPFNLIASNEEGSIKLSWDGWGGSTFQRYAVYRVTSDSKPDATLAVQDTRNLITITGETQFRDTSNTDEGKQWYFVQSVGSNSIESQPSDVVQSPVSIGRETDADLVPLSIAAYPTVFDERVQVEYSLQAATPVTLQVFDTIGRDVATLVEGKFMQPGRYAFSLSSSKYALPSGIYWIVLNTNQQRVTQAIIRIR